MRLLDFACGLMAGWTQILIGQPLDFLKTKYQIGEGGKKSPLSLIRDIYREFGVKGLYRGASSLFMGHAGVIGVEFFGYEWAKRHLFHNFGNREGPYNPDKLSMWEIGLAGGLTGWAAALIWCPTEYVKIRKQISHTMTKSSAGLLFEDVLHNGGRSIFRGYWSTFAR